jgi:hypothetical protein
MLELLEDVIGINRAGLICHPYKFKMGSKKGKFVYTFDPEEMVCLGMNEAELRALIEAGRFSNGGAIFMVPAGSRNIDRRRLLTVLRYKGEPLTHSESRIMADW